MQKIAILISSLLLVSGNVLAQQSLFDTANQTLDKAQDANAVVNGTPASLQDQAEQSAKDKLYQAAPGELQQGVQTYDAAQQLKSSVPTPGGAANAVEGQVKQKAAEKLLDSLQ